MNIGLLKQLSEVSGIPGREEQVRTLIEHELQDVVDAMETDVMGNLMAYKHGPPGAKRIMISAHMDEIGFLVRHIDDKGFLRVHNVGGFDTRNLLARQVTVHASHGGALLGVMNPSGKPIHISTPEERSHIPLVEELMIDLGRSADEVKQRVRIGDMVTLRQECLDLGEVVTGKALDDRALCFVLIELLKILKTPKYEVVAVFSTQEEVGLRGATTSAYHLNPDIGIALDTTLAVDTPGVKPELSVTQLGKGVAIKIMDKRSISTRSFVDALMTLAEQHDIPYQLEVLPLGGTDAGAIQLSRAGVSTVTLSLPCRYIHTVTEMTAKSDIQGCIDLLHAYVS